MTINAFISSSSPRVIITDHDFLWYAISFQSFWVSCLRFFCTLSQLTVQAECENEETFMLCKDCSAVATTLMDYQFWFSYKSKADQHMVCCEEN